jgi:hypothetical protein
MDLKQTDVETIHPIRKQGIRINKLLYDQIVDFIIGHIRTHQHVSLTQLLMYSEKSFPGIREVGWLIYQVKLDLEARGFIKDVPCVGMRELALKITPSGSRELISFVKQ